MKRLLFTLFLILSWAGKAEAQGQSTTVTLQVTDAGAQSWNNGTWTVVLVSPPGVQNYGPPFNLVSGGTVTGQTQSGALSGTGGAPLTLTPNASISPSQSVWNFTVCPQQGVPYQCFTRAVTIAGASQTVTIVPLAISVNCGPGVNAYADSEVGCQVGGQYYNLTTPAQRQCTASTGTFCSTFVAAGGGGITSVAVLGACVSGGTNDGITVYLNTASSTLGKGNYTCTNGIWVAQPSTIGAIYPSNFGVLSDGRFVYDAVVTNGSAILTSATAGFTANAKGGQLVQAAECGATCGGGGAGLVGLSALNTTTILSIDSNTQIHASANGTASATGTAVQLLIWGDDDTTAWGLAVTAATTIGGNHCKSIMVPVGLTLLTAGIGNTTYTCGIQTDGPGQEGLEVLGYGQLESLFVIMQSFNYATCTGTASTCLFGVPGTQYFNFGVWGGEVSVCNGGQSGKAGFVFGTDNRFQGIGISGWCAAHAQNFVAIITNGTFGSAPGILFSTLQDAGSVGLRITNGAQWFPMSHSYIGNNGDANIQIMGGGSRTVFSSDNNVFGIISSTSGALAGVDVGCVVAGSGCSGLGGANAVFNSTNDQCYGIVSVTNETCIVVRAGDEANVTNDWLDPGTGTTTKGVYIQGGILRASLTHFNGTADDIFADTGGTFFDGEGNKFLKGVQFGIFPTCAESAGNGTCAVTAGSLNEKGVVRITAGTTTTTNPSFTLTFSGTFAGANAAAPTCQFFLQNTGSAAWTTSAPAAIGLPYPTAISSASVTVGITTTVGLVATSTYDVSYTCRAK